VVFRFGVPTSLALLLWACASVGSNSAGAAPDAGDGPATSPPSSYDPLRCDTRGTFDPCGAALQTATFLALRTDGGAVDEPDGGSGSQLPKDGGLSDASACSASGAIRLG